MTIVKENAWQPRNHYLLVLQLRCYVSDVKQALLLDYAFP